MEGETRNSNRLHKQRRGGTNFNRNENWKSHWAFRSIIRIDCCKMGKKIQVIVELSRRVIDGLGMPNEWALSSGSNLQEKGDISNCS